jgi:hypothetical protein
MKKQLDVTLIPPQTETPALLDSWVTTHFLYNYINKKRASPYPFVKR